MGLEGGPCHPLFSQGGRTEEGREGGTRTRAVGPGGCYGAGRSGSGVRWGRVERGGCRGREVRAGEWTRVEKGEEVWVGW